MYTWFPLKRKKHHLQAPDLTLHLGEYTRYFRLYSLKVKWTKIPPKALGKISFCIDWI